MTDVLAILKSPNRNREIKTLLRAVGTRRLTLAAFNLFDPLPFFAEFGLWATQGLSRQKKAQSILAKSGE
jgi:hypothetical protein